MAESYYNASNVLFNTIKNSGNTNFGIGVTLEEAERKSLENYRESDAVLFIPALFSCFQSVELFAKGIILLNSHEFQITHDMENIIKNIGDIYGENSEIYNSFYNFYNYDNESEILNRYKNENNIVYIKQLYESFRYPEIHMPNQRGLKYIEDIYLKHNYKKGIALVDDILCLLNNIHDNVLIEYKNAEMVKD